MTAYVIRRILVVIPTFFGITVIIFFLIQLAPGTIIDFHLSANPELMMDERQVQAIEERLGLGRPLHMQYLIWVGNLLRWDFGYSFATNRTIASEIGARIGATAALFMFSYLLARPLAILLGMLSAIKPNSIGDHCSRAFALLGISMPAFWIGIMLLFVFGVTFRWFPIGGSRSFGIVYANIFHLIGNRIWHLVLPSVTIALRGIAVTMRVTRDEMLEVMGKDYIAAARAKGLRESVVYAKHALRNALMPIVTLIGLSMGQMLSGAVLTETVFGWPGLGRYLVRSVRVRDYPAVMAVAVIVSVMVLLANLIADLAYSWINPKIRY